MAYSTDVCVETVVTFVNMGAEITARSYLQLFRLPAFLFQPFGFHPKALDIRQRHTGVYQFTIIVKP